MNTEEIIKSLKLTAKLMELHNENPFKVKSISNAVFKLDKVGVDLASASLDELEQIDGIGKGIAHKIHELQTTNELKELNQLMGITPVGVIDMLTIKGLGPKKVGQLWHELNIESTGELLYACHENRLVALKGFGAKTQEAVKKAIEFKQANAGKFHYASVEQYAIELVDLLKKKNKTELVSLTGAIRRKCEVLEQIDIVVGSESKIELPVVKDAPAISVNLITCSPDDFYSTLFKTTATPEHVNGTGFQFVSKAESEEKIYDSLGLQYIEPELREGKDEVELARKNKIPGLIKVNDLKGILHNHSTYSDGLNTLKEMAVYCKELGYEYLGICDHSQTAVYAGGLKPERVREQHTEIEALNKELAPFKIFKGIESDILNDGSLDYKEDILKTFDFVVASIHQNFKMDIDKATSRLIRAIENPYTTILGHPTGRLLLYRAGYPVDHKKIIDACAANNVVMELNSHPYRLDIDWRWIRYCLEKGVKISINPDAHEKQGYHDMYYGVCIARKGMLTKEMCFNTLTREEIIKHFNTKNPKS
ncbi:MAG: DNA polymerase/3'-5' exonuclease PolX [Bacteroidia bacterium]|nr:DNA polymerase/3'-5' exonuclease PolX [Bacteroidia bacterium]